MAFRKMCLPKLAVNSLLFLGYASLATTSVWQQSVLGDDKSGNSPFDEAFEKLANETLKLWEVPGVSIAVVDGDETWAAGYGIATFPSTAVEPSTLFCVGSTTKAFTAAAMSFLVDDDERYPGIYWNTTIAQIIREDFVLEDNYVSTHVTVEDALSHRTGMPRHDLAYGGQFDGHRMTPGELVHQLRYLPLTAEPRTRFQYCNMMYVVISHIIRKLTGSSLEDVIGTHILEPLGMNSTYFSTEDARNSPQHYAQGYYAKNGDFHEVPDMYLPEVQGAGFIVSNVLDYTKWIRTMIDQAPPMSKAAHKALRTARTLDETPEPYMGVTAYTLGWVTGVFQGYEWFQHSGGMEAFGADVIFFPALRYGLVAFGNTAVTSNFAEEALIWHLVNEKLKIPEKERFDRNKKNQEASRKQAARYKAAKSFFYPSIPLPPLPLSRHISAYTGTYFHPGYRNMTITLRSSLTSPGYPSTLRIDRTDVTWKLCIDLEHISGEYFIGWADSLVAPGGPFKMALPAEFRLTKDGNVAQFGVLLEPEMGDEKIWFDRV